jgi:hypothetical protein
MACLNLELPLLQCLLVLSFVSGTGFSFLPCPLPFPRMKVCLLSGALSFIIT